MVYSARKVVAAHGVPEPLLPAATAHNIRLASWLTVAADRGNAGICYVGGLGVNGAVAVCNSVDNAGAYIGHPLVPPAGATSGSDFVNFREIGGPGYIDLALIYVDVDSSGDNVTFNWGIR